MNTYIIKPYRKPIELYHTVKELQIGSNLSIGEESSTVLHKVSNQVTNTFVFDLLDNWFGKNFKQASSGQIISCVLDLLNKVGIDVVIDPTEADYWDGDVSYSE